MVIEELAKEETHLEYKQCKVKKGNFLTKYVFQFEGDVHSSVLYAAFGFSNTTKLSSVTVRLISNKVYTYRSIQELDFLTKMFSRILPEKEKLRLMLKDFDI